MLQVTGGHSQSFSYLRSDLSRPPSPRATLPHRRHPVVASLAILTSTPANLFPHSIFRLRLANAFVGFAIFQKDVPGLLEFFTYSVLQVKTHKSRERLFPTTVQASRCFHLPVIEDRRSAGNACAFFQPFQPRKFRNGESLTRRWCCKLHSFASSGIIFIIWHHQN